MHSRIAAIDVGSNSMRVAVIDTDGRAYLEVVQEARDVPRLIRDVRANGRLSPDSIARIVNVLRDFIAIARTSHASEVAAVATSAVRDAANAAELVACVRRELGLDLRVVSGEEEARLAFLGALHSLPVTHGVVVDVGGGSAEVVRFRDRAPEALATLQLGAVRLSDDFLTVDPPAPDQLRALRKHLRQELSRAGLTRLRKGASFVGTGGTVRNLAKIARDRYGYPLAHLHGYVLTRERLQEITAELARASRAERLAIPGLNEDRADTIAAGALLIEAMLDALEADHLVVSGRGLREGVAIAHAEGALIPLPALRAAAVDNILARFAPDAAEASARRARIAAGLAGALPAAPGDPEDVLGALPIAAALLDAGRGIDYYNRHRHTESILLARGLDGFTHREQALLGALVRQAGSERYDPLACAPLTTEADRGPLARAATLLSLADELEQRLPASLFQLNVRADLATSEVVIAAPLPRGWDPAPLHRRFARAFNLSLVLSPPTEV